MDGKVERKQWHVEIPPASIIRGVHSAPRVGTKLRESFFFPESLMLKYQLSTYT